MIPNRIAFVLLLVCVAGCDSLPAPADPQQSRMALEAALDAWRDGETPASLQERAPAIYFNDDEWRPENRLMKYNIESESAHGQGWLCQVLLTGQAAGGKAFERRVTYLIDTGASIVIVQQP